MLSYWCRRLWPNWPLGHLEDLSKRRTETLLNYEKTELGILNDTFLHTKIKVRERPTPRCTCTDQPFSIACRYRIHMVENEKYSKEQMVGNPTGTRETLPQDITHKRLRFVRGQHRSVPAPANLPQLHEMVPYILHIYKFTLINLLCIRFSPAGHQRHRL